MVADYEPLYNYETVDRTSSHRPDDLNGQGFQLSAHRNSDHQDDVDLEALVNDMNSSLESLYSSCNTHTETAPLLHNSHVHTPDHGHAPHRRGPRSQRPTPLIPLSCPQERLCRSQPVHINAFMRLQEEQQQCRPSSLPAVINPFPELCTPTGSPILSLIHTTDNHIVNVYSEDGAGKVVEVPADMRARDVCQLLIYKSHCLDDNSWSLVEHHPLLGLERYLEDHELVVKVQASMTSDSKFLFRKNYAKYEFFRNPLNFFPEQMVAWCQVSNGSIPQSQLLQNFLNSSSCPEVQGFLYLKESGRKSWKRLSMFLRRSGLYYSTKGSSKEPRHLQLLSDLEDSSVFTVTTGRKLHNAPTDYQFCIKPSKVRSECKELRMLCAEDEQSRTCWMTAFRLLKYGILLYQNYKSPQQRESPVSHFSNPVRSVSENSLVAMDFSGRTGRVIENPLEAQSAAVEEGQTWRKRGHRMNALGSPSLLHPSSLSSDPQMMQSLLHSTLGLNTSLCNWMLDLLMGHPQVLRVSNNTSATLIHNTGAPQGCVPSPLYSLFTHDCMARHDSNTIIKFADDTTVVDLITDNDETAYREEVRDLAVWCQDNNLSLNVIKAMEMFVDDYRKRRTEYTPLSSTEL
ncbi:growth factor receptor-bound protein 10-like isoform X2 [Oncorhynchus keta]|uniref:growth factor receptor-bound protein 10-like isoform X2 n=1 Tax=Oncorhynchus keta TaxID=8018 RepID=UPI00227A8C10|nr:growth factor receptor-bound protein 10-like isoform X2 [Oncorhynchus keta]